jgi:hypothetical protein
MHTKTTVVAALAFALLAAAPGAGAFSIGPGGQPGLAVDAAGTAYVAWNGPSAVLRFCRIPRGATACDPTAAASIAVPGSGSSGRPFVVVSGSRVVVVQQRYGAGVAGFSALYAFTSHDGGVSFPEQRVIGKIAPNEAIPGPGDTISGVSDDNPVFQNAPLDGSAPVNLGGTSAVGSAALSTDHPYYGTIALLDASTPLAVFQSGTGAGQFRRYDGSGDINDVANWTTAADIGAVRYPKLAGGPSGLFLLSTTESGEEVVSKFTGAGFGTPVMLGITADPPSQHMFQDAAGRLHAVFMHGDGSGLHLMHAVSDNGANWRIGTVVTVSTPGGDGGIGDTRVATAPDHIGVVVWRGGSPVGEIRVAAVGPDAPVDPVPKPAPAPQPAPIPPPTPKPAPVIKPLLQPTKRLTVKEGSYALGGVPVCVKNGSSYSVTLAFKRAKAKNNVVVKLRRADFFLGTKRVLKDTSAPFVAAIRVTGAKAGKTYTVSARAYLKVRRGPARTRSISRSVKTC